MADRRAALTALLLACLLALAGCGGGVRSGTTSPSVTALPLQSRGLAVGGDVQTRATDVVEYGITEQQLDQIAKECKNVTDWSSEGAEECVKRVIRVGHWPPPRCKRICLTVHSLGRADSRALGQAGYVEVTDTRPESSQCAKAERNVCLRIGLPQEADLRRAAPSAASGETTSTTTHPESTTDPGTATPSPSATTASPTKDPTDEATNQPTGSTRPTS